MALAISPGIASGSVTVRKHVQGEAPRLRDASSSEVSTEANAAEAIHTASTSPCDAWTSTTPRIVPFRPIW